VTPPENLPDDIAHLPRERAVEPGPAVCLCCGSPRLRKLGEDITETLEVIPRQWKVIQHVREKFTCRDCEKISQAPAPFHVIARGWAGPSLLAMILFEKYGQHQPLNRQAERYARAGVPLSLSTLADQVGSCCAVLAPLLRRVEAHVLAAARLHGDDTRRGGVLGPCPPTLLPDGRSHRERPAHGAGQSARCDLAAGAGGSPAHWMVCPPSPGTASSVCSRSSPIKEPPETRHRRSNQPNSPACGAHRMETLV
jgi:transposase